MRESHHDWEGSVPTQLMNLDPTSSAAVAERVKDALDGRSVRSLSDALGLNRETLRRYVNQGEMPVDALCRICRELDVSPLWILMQRGPKRLSQLPEAGPLIPESGWNVRRATQVSSRDLQTKT